MTSRPYQLLIFDWDGTLIDSIDTIVACTEATIETLGLDPLPQERIRAAIGTSLRETVEFLAPGCDEGTFQSVVDTYRELWWSGYNRQAKLFAGVESMLRDLVAEGYILALATAKNRSGLEADWEKTGVGDLFAASRTVSESKPKPGPEMVLDILEELGASNETSLVIGDSRHDIQMAQRARVDIVAVASGAQPEAALNELNPLACLQRAVDLPPWLERRPVAVRED